MDENIGIYKLSWSNGFYYYGQSKSLNTRRQTHFASFKRGNHDSEKLQNAYNKFGLPNFTIVELCAEKDLNKVEHKYISLVALDQNCLNKNGGTHLNKGDKSIEKQMNLSKGAVELISLMQTKYSLNKSEAIGKILNHYSIIYTKKEGRKIIVENAWKVLKHIYAIEDCMDMLGYTQEDIISTVDHVKKHECATQSTMLILKRHAYYFLVSSKEIHANEIFAIDSNKTPGTFGFMGDATYMLNQHGSWEKAN